MTASTKAADNSVEVAACQIGNDLGLCVGPLWTLIGNHCNRLRSDVAPTSSQTIQVEIDYEDANVVLEGVM